MVFTIAEQIESLSRQMTLLPGDIIATGTCSGVGGARDIYLKAGDRVRMEIEGLGAELIAHECAESLDAAGTRVWAASECLKKAGMSTSTPLLFDSVETDGWVRFTAGWLATATYIELPRKQDDELCFAIVTEIPHANV